MVSEEHSVQPSLGDSFPELTVQTSQGELTLPDAYEDEWFVLFSHPGDFTPVCTTEFVAFQQRKDEFDELGVNLVGLSHRRPGETWAQRRCRARRRRTHLAQFPFDEDTAHLFWEIPALLTV